ncbi:FtsX-like permease family protein [Halorarius halobius]|uniref:FtsX-like permease family protein n=1 Tax=Halorarius halobius TaxID=2962671 RepID=UPI0020CEF610|nr:FtsX-like permease family protein [Halorarius halobius]
MGRLARWRAIAGLGVRTTLTKLRTGGQSTLSVVGVALAVGLMLTVTSIGIGLATGGVAAGGSTDYLITPSGDAGSVVAGVEGQQLGGVHPATQRIEALDGVRWATPVLVSIGKVDIAGERNYMLVVGVVPGDGTRVAGLSTDGLRSGDPMYDDGNRTGEAVISTAAAEELGYTTGDSFSLVNGASDANRTFGVVDVVAPSEPGLGQLPVAVVHLRELQAITGGADSDVANRILVSGSGDGLEERLQRVYPSADVETRSELLREQALDSQLTLAVGVGAFVVAVVVGILFIATTMGFELAAERSDRLVMRAVGVSRRSRLALVAVRTLAVCLLGGVGGLLLWLAGAGLVNVAARWVSGGVAIAVLHPALAALGLTAALLIGLVTTPYLLVVSRFDDDEVVP